MPLHFIYFNSLAKLRSCEAGTPFGPGAVIDNLTATIVCVKILKRVVPHKKAPRRKL